MNKRLVAFFSVSGVTASLARTLADVAGADLYDIKPLVPYTKADLDWTDKKSRSTVEMQDPSSRPVIAGKDANVTDYDVIFVGFPIWWYVAPTVVNSFLEAYDFSGKIVIPFATSGGSGLGKTIDKLKPSVSTSTILREGTLLNGKPSKDALAEWITSLNL